MLSDYQYDNQLVMIRFRRVVHVNGIELDIHNQSSLLHLAAAHGWMD